MLTVVLISSVHSDEYGNRIAAGSSEGILSNRRRNEQIKLHLSKALIITTRLTTSERYQPLLLQVRGKKIRAFAAHRDPASAN